MLDLSWELSCCILWCGCCCDCVHVSGCNRYHATDVDPESGDTALHVACRMGDDVAAKLLVSAAPTLCASVNHDGDTPLQIAHTRQRQLRLFGVKTSRKAVAGTDEQSQAEHQLRMLSARCARLVQDLSHTLRRLTSGRNVYRREATSVEVVAWILQFLSATEQRRAAGVCHGWTWASLEATRLSRLEMEENALARHSELRKTLPRLNSDKVYTPLGLEQLRVARSLNFDSDDSEHGADDTLDPDSDWCESLDAACHRQLFSLQPRAGQLSRIVSKAIFKVRGMTPAVFIVLRTVPEKLLIV